MSWAGRTESQVFSFLALPMEAAVSFASSGRWEYSSEAAADASLRFSHGKC